MSTELVEILLATYNGERYLRDQLESLQRQDHANWKVLFRDDGSTDRTVEILRGCVEKDPDRFEEVRDDRGRLGYSGNFAALLERASARYMMFCDQDDVWRPDKIAYTLGLMRAAEAESNTIPLVVFTDLAVVAQDLNPVADSIYQIRGIQTRQLTDIRFIALTPVFYGCTMMLNQKAKALALPIPEFAPGHDWWIGLNAAIHGRLIFGEKSMVLYRRHGESVVQELHVTGAETGPQGPRGLSRMKRMWRFYRRVHWMLRELRYPVPMHSILLCKLIQLAKRGTGLYRR